MNNKFKINENNIKKFCDVEGIRLATITMALKNMKSFIIQKKGEQWYHLKSQDGIYFSAYKVQG